MSHVDNIKHYAVDMVMAGVSSQEMCRATQLSHDTIDRILEGKSSRLKTVQSFAEAFGMNLAQLLLGPDEDPDAYADADVRYFAANIHAAVKADIRSPKALEREMMMPVGSFGRFFAGTLPRTDTLQTMADVLHIGVADLFLPTDALQALIKTPAHGVPEPRPDQLSHVSYANDHIKAMVQELGSCKVAGLLGNCAQERVEQFARGGRMSYRTMVAMGRELGLSIGEVLLRPGVDTAWYADTDARYFADNLEAIMRDMGISSVTLGKRVGVNSSSVNAWREGKAIPYSDNLQRLADALDMEVADLFLPPE